MRSTRSYQREIQKLRQTIADMQWVRPSYNGADSCSGCGNMRHHGCDVSCPAAPVTKDFGGPENEN